MIDITSETVIDLYAAANRVSVSHRTIRKWASRVGHRLETAKLGGKVVTSLEALQRFSNQRGDDNCATVASFPRTPRDGSTAALKRELAEF